MNLYLMPVFFIILFTGLPAFAKLTDPIPQKVIYIRSEVLIQNSIDKMIADEIQFVLIELNRASEIDLLPESVWGENRELFTKTDDRKAQYQILVDSEISGIIQSSLFYGRDSYQIRFKSLSLITGTLNEDLFIMPVQYTIDDLTDFRDFVRSKTLQYFSRISQKQLNDSFQKARNFLRKNPDYELTIGTGFGYYYRQPFGSEIQSHGLNSILFLEGKWDYLSLKSYFETAVFWDYPDQPDFDPLIHIQGRLDLGGWILGELFRIGGGFGIFHGYFFYEEQYQIKNTTGYDYWYYEMKVESITEALLFGSFYFKPSNRLIIGLLMGSFINLVNVADNRHSDGPPLFGAFMFRYFITDHLFLDFHIPTYGYSKIIRENERRSSNQTNINISIGWKFFWRLE